MKHNLWIFAILAVALIFVFTACNGGDSTQGGDVGTPTPEPTPVG